MPRASNVSVENNFSRGLITEATAMNFPENAVVETDNCVFLRNGKVVRRLGIDYEDGYQLHTYSSLSVLSNNVSASYSEAAIKEFEWTAVDNDGDTSFVVVQLGDRIHFFEVTTGNTVSSNHNAHVISLLDYRVNSGTTDSVYNAIANQECSFSSGFGRLFVVHPLCEPFYVEYSAGTFTETEITVEVRDFVRLDDSLDIDERPNALTNTHKYNLYNQGWYADTIDAAGTGNVQVLTHWDSSRTDFPSNADIWWAFKNDSQEFDPSWPKHAVTNTLAPNGHYIYNAFNVNRITKTGFASIQEDTTTARPARVAFFAGRAFYSGPREDGYYNKIYFSQIVQSPLDFGKCYQLSDPTGEDVNELLESDGGVLVIPEAGEILELLSVGPSLMVFCRNGVWAISGRDGATFKANDYGITRLGSTGANAPNNIVLAEGLPFWWNASGIFTIKDNQIVSVTDDSIRSHIQEITDENKLNIKGIYNHLHKTIVWLYKVGTPSSVQSKYEYTNLLIFNLLSNSFSIFSLAEAGGPHLVGGIFTSKSGEDTLLQDERASPIQFLVAGDIGTAGAKALTFAQFKNEDYLDWYTYNGGTSFDSYFISGHKVRGNMLTKFQSNYMVIIAEGDENSGALVQGVWDWSDGPSSGRYTTSQQIYNYYPGRNYYRRKIKIRGNGYSLQLKFRSQTGKDFTIVGWATSETGTNVP